VALNYVTVTGTFDDGTGAPISSGIVTFTPSSAVYASGVPLATPASPVVAQIVAGALKSPSGGTLQLLATDNSGLTVEGLTGFWYWTVTVNIGGATQTFSFFLPHTPTTVDLYALANTAAGGGGATLPLTTLGDILYENATPAAARLPGNTTAAKQFLTQTGTGTISAAPAWAAIAPADVPGVDGVTVTGTPSSGQVVTATGSSAATWQSPASVYQPYQFQPETYGAKGDGKSINDATIAGGSLSTLTSATAAFTSGDTGKSILIVGAGATGGFLATTITFVNSTTVTLGTAASGAITAQGALYGTDDTTAIQNCINAANTYAQANKGFCEILFGDKIYCVAGAFVIGGTPEGNAQITLPIVSTTGLKSTMRLTGVGPTGAPHFTQTVPNLSGTVIAGMRTDGTFDNTYNAASVIGGPFNGYGSAGGLWTNLEIQVKGLTFTMAWPTTCSALDLFGVSTAVVEDMRVFPLFASVGGAPWPQLSSGSINPQFPFALRMPTVGNGGRADIGYLLTEGMGYGLVASEHTTAHNLETGGCHIGMAAAGGASAGNACHGISILYWDCEGTNTPLRFNVGAAGYGGLQPIGVQVLQFDTESYAANRIVDCGGSAGVASGQMWFADNSDLNSYYSNSLIANGGGFRLYATSTEPGPIASPQAAPTSTNPWLNGYYRDAEITLSVAGGTLSALTINAPGVSAVSQTVPASTTFYRFTLGSGQTYTPTFTGTLTHTVTLL
jgi:hypothetical protein